MVTALDFSKTALKFCLQNARRYGIENRIILVQSPVEQLPFDDNYFDTVIAADIVEHIYEPQAFFREIMRVLKPGGKAVLETPNIEFMAFPGHGLIFKNILDRIKHLPENLTLVPNVQPHFTEVYHVNNYTIRRFRSEIREAGLILQHLDTKGWWLEMRGYDRMLNHLFTKLSDLPLLHNLFIRFSDTDIVAMVAKPDKASDNQVHVNL